MYIEMALFVFSVAIIVGLLILACVRDDMDSGARMINKNEEEEKKTDFLSHILVLFFTSFLASMMIVLEGRIS